MAYYTSPVTSRPFPSNGLRAGEGPYCVAASRIRGSRPINTAMPLFQPSRAMPPKKKAKADPPMAKLATSWKTKPYTKIAPQRLGEFNHRPLNIPGRYWKNGPAAERDMLFPAKVVQTEIRHHFTGIREPIPAVQTEFQGSTGEAEWARTKDGELPWLDIDMFSEYWSEHEERERGKLEEQQRAAAIAERSSFENAEEVVAEPKEAAAPRRISNVYEFFGEPVFVADIWLKTKKLNPGPLDQLRDGVVYQPAQRRRFRCLLPGCTISRNQDGSGNGSLTDHLKGGDELHKAAYRSIALTSKHTSSQLRGEDGDMVEIFSFKEDFKNKQNFAVKTYRLYEPPSHARHEALREYTEGLEPRHTPPSQETTRRGGAKPTADGYGCRKGAKNVSFGWDPYPPTPTPTLVLHG